MSGENILVDEESNERVLIATPEYAERLLEQIHEKITNAVAKINASNSESVAEMVRRYNAVAERCQWGSVTNKDLTELLEIKQLLESDLSHHN